MNQTSLIFEPASVALLGFGEAGNVLAGGLCAASGWLAAAPGSRELQVIDTALGHGARVPLLLSGQRAPDLLAFATAIGTPARVLGEQIGAASSVKILRTIMMKGIEALAVECLVAARRQGLVEQVLDNVGDVDQVGFANWLRVLTISHLTHARRRMEEVDKAIDNLEQTGITPIMSPATRRSHLRTVEAGLATGETSGIDLDTALQLLDERVIGRGRQ